LETVRPSWASLVLAAPAATADQEQAEVAAVVMGLQDIAAIQATVATAVIPARLEFLAQAGFQVRQVRQGHPELQESPAPAATLDLLEVTVPAVPVATPAKVAPAGLVVTPAQVDLVGQVDLAVPAEFLAVAATVATLAHLEFLAQVDLAAPAEFLERLGLAAQVALAVFQDSPVCLATVATAATLE